MNSLPKQNQWIQQQPQQEKQRIQQPNNRNGKPGRPSTIKKKKGLKTHQKNDKNIAQSKQYNNKQGEMNYLEQNQDMCDSDEEEAFQGLVSFFKNLHDKANVEEEQQLQNQQVETSTLQEYLKNINQDNNLLFNNLSNSQLQQQQQFYQMPDQQQILDQYLQITGQKQDPVQANIQSQDQYQQLYDLNNLQQIPFNNDLNLYQENNQLILNQALEQCLQQSQNSPYALQLLQQYLNYQNNNNNQLLNLYNSMLMNQQKQDQGLQNQELIQNLLMQQDPTKNIFMNQDNQLMNMYINNMNKDIQNQSKRQIKGDWDSLKQRNGRNIAIAYFIREKVQNSKYQ